MKNRLTGTVIAGLSFTLLLLLCNGRAMGDSARDLVSRGNDQFQQGNYQKAIEYYDRASVRDPESAVILFNLGDAYYRKDDYGKAREFFEKTTMKSTSLSLEGRAWYNMGNCAFREGDRQLDSDMEKALQSYRESVKLYYTALAKDSTLTEAKHNMEIARLKIKDLLDRIKQRRKEMEKQQKEMKAVVDSLLALIRRQQVALDRSVQLDQDSSMDPQRRRVETARAKEYQESIQEGTAEVINRINQISSKQKAPPLENAVARLDSSVTSQEDAISDLKEAMPGRAVPDQQTSLEQMKRALEKLTGGEKGSKQQNNQKDKQGQQPREQQNQQGRKKQQQNKKQHAQTAREILDEERKNREERRRAAAGGYRRVEKDW